MTLRRQSARFCSCSLATLHVPWARTSSCTEPRFQDPARSCLLQVFYAKLSQSSTQVWPVILTSVRLPVGTGQDAELQKTRDWALLALYLLQEKKNSLVNSTYAGASCPLHLDSPVDTGTSRPFSIVSLNTTSSHGLMLVRDSTSRCTNDSTLTVTCYLQT